MKLKFKTATGFYPENVGYAMHFEKGPSQFEFTERDAETLIRIGNAEEIKEGANVPSSDGQSNAVVEPQSGGSLVCPAGCNDGKPFANAQGLAAHRRAKQH